MRVGYPLLFPHVLCAVFFPSAGLQVAKTLWTAFSNKCILQKCPITFVYGTNKLLLIILELALRALKSILLIQGWGRGC